MGILTAKKNESVLECGRSMSLEVISLDNITEIAHHYGYLAVFIGIALENTGIPLPGETMTIVGGFLAGSGELSYYGVLSSAIAGAIVGDNFGYWIGRSFGWEFVVKVGKIFRLKEEQLEAVKDKYSKNAGSAVFWGRFITLLRIFAGPLAGIAKMPYRKFLIYNSGGATVWALSIVSLSFFLGNLASLEKIVTWVSEAGILTLILVIVALSVPLAIGYIRNKKLTKT